MGNSEFESTAWFLNCKPQEKDMVRETWEETIMGPPHFF
jgi:hypothetical protein